MSSAPGRALPFPRTKISPPDTSRLVARPRLFARLDQTRHYGPIMLVAPGGSGKTALVASWLRARQPGRVLWYVLDQADQDVRRFLSGLCASLEHVQPGSGGAPQALIEGGEPAATVVAALATALEELPTTVVLDEFHFVDGAPALPELVRLLVRFAGPETHFVLLSRTLLPLRYSMLAGSMEPSVDAHELLLTPTECAEVLAARGLPLDAAGELVRRSGGWAAGLLAMARAQRLAPSAAGLGLNVAFAIPGTQLLEALDAGMRSFALESAAVCPATYQEVAALLGRPDVPAAFEALRARGFFLTDRDRGVVRYLDVLQAHLCAVLAEAAPERYRSLRRSRAALYVEVGEPEQAATLLRDDADWEALAELLREQVQALAARRSFSTIASCTEALPPALRSADLMARCGNACRMLLQFGRAVSWADAALQATEDASVTCNALLARASALYECGRYVEVPLLTQRCRQAAPGLRDPALRARAMAMAADVEGLVLLALGRRQEGEAQLAQAEAHFAAAGATWSQARAIMNRALGLAAAGWGAEALAQVERALPLARQIGDDERAAYGVLVRALARWLADGPAAALQGLREAAEALAAAGMACAACCAQGDVAQAVVEIGDLARGEELARQALASARGLDNEAAVRTAQRALIGAAIGRRATGEVRRLVADARHGGLPPPERATLDYLDGYCALRSGAYRAAAETLGRAAATLEQLDHPHLAARAYLLRGEALLAQGCTRQAAEAINAAAKRPAGGACDGYLLPLQRHLPTTLAKYATLFGLRASTRLLLRRIAAGGATPAVAERRGPARIEVQPFGFGRVAIDGTLLDTAELGSKAQELLHYLATQDGPMHRTGVLAALWPEAPPKRGNAALTRAVFRLRCALGDGCLPPYQEELGLHATVHDAGRALLACMHEACAACHAGDFARAAASVAQATTYLEAGEFLPWCESQWAAEARARYLAAGSRLAALARVPRQDPALAGALERCCRAVIALDPVDADAWSGLVRLYLTAGRSDEARRCRQDYARACREEL